MKGQGLDFARQGPPTALGTNGKVSRRGVLGAAAALPFIATAAAAEGPLHHASRGFPPRPGEEWQHALTAYRGAEAAVEEAGRPLDDARDRVCAGAAQDEIRAAEDAFGDRLEEMYGALRRMMLVPAPDVGAFCAKVEAMIELELPTLCDSAASLAAVREDARRLGEGASRKLIA